MCTPPKRYVFLALARSVCVRGVEVRQVHREDYSCFERSSISVCGAYRRAHPGNHHAHYLPRSCERISDAVVSSRPGSTLASVLPSPSGASTYLTETELTQWRSLVSVKRSPSKTSAAPASRPQAGSRGARVRRCAGARPRWPPHPAHMISTRCIPMLTSVCVTTDPSTILSNAGQPHPESNLAAAE